MKIARKYINKVVKNKPLGLMLNGVDYEQRIDDRIEGMRILERQLTKLSKEE